MYPSPPYPITMEDLKKLDIDLYKLTLTEISKLSPKQSMAISTLLNNLISKIAESKKSFPSHGRATTKVETSHPAKPEVYIEIGRIIWSLFADGIIAPHMNHSGEFDFKYFLLTLFGATVSKDIGEPTPYEPESFVRKLSKIANKFGNKLDEVIEFYIRESCTAFKSGCYKSSAVMLGVASERLIDILYENLLQFGMPKSKKDWLNKKFEHIKKYIENNLQKEMLRKFKETIEPVFNLIRIYRNEHGHPNAVTVDKDKCYANLFLFISYFESVFQFIEDIKK